MLYSGLPNSPVKKKVSNQKTVEKVAPAEKVVVVHDVLKGVSKSDKDADLDYTPDPASEEND